MILSLLYIAHEKGIEHSKIDFNKSQWTEKITNKTENIKINHCTMIIWFDCRNDNAKIMFKIIIMNLSSTNRIKL